MNANEIEQYVEANHFLAKDRYIFTDQGVDVGTNIFHRFKFSVCKYTLFENFITKLDNESLLNMYDSLEKKRHIHRLKQHYKIQSSLHLKHEIISLYLKVLLDERSRKHSSIDVPATRFDIANFARMAPEITSEELIITCNSI
ncbi:hypothetical protein [Photobacterium leiognathi]|uniref:hypothetical protein n=1 Tax=Photobacterium leiognathi TaxID=553611 RepID=UPI002980CA05|nr:hypothetical protein [Photobacterium leiognathi]